MTMVRDWDPVVGLSSCPSVVSRLPVGATEEQLHRGPGAGRAPHPHCGQVGNTRSSFPQWINPHPPCDPHPFVLEQEEDEENLYSSIQQLRDRTSELSSQVSSYERTNNCDSRYQQRLDELRAAQERLMELTEVRNRK